MKTIKKLGIFALVLILLFSLLSVNVFATDENSGTDTEKEVDTGVIQEDATQKAESDGKLDKNLKPESFSERLEYALQGTATGMLMIFAVLALLTIILYISKYVFYDIPNKAREATRPVDEEAKIIAAEPVASAVTPTATVASISAPSDIRDDGELAAVITAAIAAMIESGDYKNEFVGGFRVVSFKRSEKTAWNRK